MLNKLTALTFYLLLPGSITLCQPFGKVAGNDTNIENRQPVKNTIFNKIATEVITNIHGNITNIQDGSPIEKAIVQLDSTNWIDTTNSQGEFRFESISPGQFNLSITHYHFIDTVLYAINMLEDSMEINVQLSPACCKFVVGDMNDDGLIRPSDVTYGVRYFKSLGPEPPYSCLLLDGQYETFFCLFPAGDANGNCEFLGSDITRLVAYF
ncbi:MAG: carboxypeptidase regulatory-like domain-containing protein [candidate division Zixibacteria bacterium]|nr:carboxypeptidase regulatory-like domain-containing protein [candidate division Zixibacteria bacterium]